MPACSYSNLIGATELLVMSKFMRLEMYLMLSICFGW
jgi:hypothetical protein